MILIGMPGREKRLARHPQFYSRIVNRLRKKAERILAINSLPAVTKEVVDAARENLVIDYAF